MSNKSLIRIVPWKECYADDFISLSIEWLEKYVSVEPADIEILYHPHESVLIPGGIILFALEDDVAVGTVAMIPTDSDCMELAKLAVTERCKGRHIGNMLMDAALDFAKEKHTTKVVLYTNRKLTPAIHLYKKHGFCEVTLENNKYLESDMKMVLDM